MIVSGCAVRDPSRRGVTHHKPYAPSSANTPMHQLTAAADLPPTPVCTDAAVGSE
jgi:hypothetical protein